MAPTPSYWSRRYQDCSPSTKWIILSILVDVTSESKALTRRRPAQTLDKTYSDRKHLTDREVERLLEATRGSRNEARDRCLILLIYRHGLRVSEACGLKLDQVDAESRVIHVRRLKGSLSTTQPLRGAELRAIAAWLRERAAIAPESSAFFVSEQRKPMHRSTVNLLLAKYSEIADLSIHAHPHMLRHACGFALADQGADTRIIQDFLGHRNIQHTVRYTATNPARFERLWR